MLARIWWKEWQALAPIISTLIVGAGLLQGFLLLYGGPDLKHGVLIPLALGWAVLYALVAGSASFAGERETRLMGFLDAVPVARGQLWLGKATFALATSFLLGVVLRLVGLAGWDGTYSTASLAFPDVDLFFALLLTEATVWGLFWSAFAKNAITAGVLAVLTTTATSSIGWGSSQTTTWGELNLPSGWTVFCRISLMVVGLATSWYVLNREFLGLIRPGRRAGGRTRLVARVARPARRSRSVRPTPAFWRLCWQTIREGRLIWAQTLALALIVPLVGRLWGFSQNEGTVWWVLLIMLAMLIQGSSVFGLESAAGTRSFLDNQAIPPRTIWAAKLGPWVLGLIGFAIVQGGAWVAAVMVTDGRRIISTLAAAISTDGLNVPLQMAWTATQGVGVFLAIAADAFALGLLGGMMFTKRITAAMIAMLGMLVLAPPQVAVAVSGMVPTWGQVLPAAILLGVSWFWVGDWLSNRGGLRRWLRLAGLVVGSFGVLILWYIAGRAWGVPDIGPQYRGNSVVQVAPSPLRQDYIRLGSFLPLTYPFPLPVERGWAAARNDQVAFWKENLGVLDETRQLAARPEVVISFDRPIRSGRQSILDPGEDGDLFEALRQLAAVWTLDGVERRSRGDFAGAWEDILAQYQISGQAAGGASSLVDHTAALNLSENALIQALAWAREPGVPLAAIRAARASLQTLPLPRIDDLLRSESRRLERSLDQPTERWVDEFMPSGRVDDPSVAFSRITLSWAVVPRWERERTRRLLRHVTALAVKFAGNDWYERDGFLPYWPQKPWWGSNPVHTEYVAPLIPTELAARQIEYATTPMADQVTSWLVGAERTYDRELTNRRALDIYLALRAWQITHGGKAPETLDELVPTELEWVPADPFAAADHDNRFSYVRGPAVEVPTRSRQDSAFDYYLGSVGLDGQRFRPPGGLPQADSYHPQMQGSDDQIFVLPGFIPTP